jgi:hypothetical protein
MYPVAAVSLCEDKERLPETDSRRLPAHMPEPVVVYFLWWPRDYIPQVEIHLRPYDIVAHSHSINPQ